MAGDEATERSAGLGADRRVGVDARTARVYRHQPLRHSHDEAITPFDRKKYPEDWNEISRRIRARAGGRCEGPPGWDELEDPDGRCPARQGCPSPFTGSKVVLTVAHVHDPDPMNCSDSNLAALCQRCHLNLDRPHHIAKARRTRRARRAIADLFDPLTP